MMVIFFIFTVILLLNVLIGRLVRLCSFALEARMRYLNVVS